MTSNETTVFWNYFVVLCEHVENLFVSELDYGLENHCSRERTQQTTGKHDCENGFSERQRQLMTNSKTSRETGTHVL